MCRDSFLMCRLGFHWVRNWIRCVRHSTGVTKGSFNRPAMTQVNRVS